MHRLRLTPTPFLCAIETARSGGELRAAASILAEAEKRHGVAFLVERPDAIPEGIISEGEIASALVPFIHDTHLVLCGDDAQAFCVIFNERMEDDFMTQRAWAWYVALWANLECAPRNLATGDVEPAWSFPDFSMRTCGEKVIEGYTSWVEWFIKAIHLKCQLFPLGSSSTPR